MSMNTANSEIIKLHTSKANSLGGRMGTVDSSDGFLHFKLSDFNEPHGKRTGTNPEELFACGYAGCFGNAVDLAARQVGISLPQVAVTAKVDLNKTDTDYYFLTIELDVGLAGVEQKLAEKVVITAHQICPYSLATRSNIDVKLRVNGQSLNIPRAA